MGWLSWLFARWALKSGALLMSTGDYDFVIAGESHYQAVLAILAGGRKEDDAEVECGAVLVPEPGNKHDSNAVKVTISGYTVAYLTLDNAPEYQRRMLSLGYEPQARCKALICGGRNHGPGGQRQFGVKLDIEWPVHVYEA